MIRRISRITPMPDDMLSVLFDDGKHVIYDGKEDMNLPGYRMLKEVQGLFAQVQLDQSRTCVYWNDEIDLPSDAMDESGQVVKENG